MADDAAAVAAGAAEAKSDMALQAAQEAKDQAERAQKDSDYYLEMAHDHTSEILARLTRLEAEHAALLALLLEEVVEDLPAVVVEDTESQTPELPPRLEPRKRGSWVSHLL